MLSNTLETNEVKNAAGTEVVFERRITEGRKTEFFQKDEPPNLPHRLTISHQETGSGINLRLRSVQRIDKTVVGVSLTPRKVSCYTVLDVPVGDLGSNDEIENVLAENMSFQASAGASATILYDCSGSGAAALRDGSL